MKTFLFNPFAKYSEKILLIFGLTITIIGGFTGYFFNATYDGVLDLHLVDDVYACQTIEYLLVDIVTMVLFLFLAGKIVNGKTRIVDLLSASLIARIPLYLLPFFNAGNHLYNITSALATKLLEGKPDAIIGPDMIYILLFAIVTLTFVVWFFFLLWNGFKVATNAKGIKPIILFITAVLLAEVCSKIIILNL